MKTWLRESFNLSSIPLGFLTHGTRHYPLLKDLCNAPFESVFTRIGVPFNPDFIDLHLSTGIGAYTVALAGKYMCQILDRLEGENDQDYPVFLGIAASLAQSVAYEIRNMMHRQKPFDWNDLNCCVVMLAVFYLVNMPDKHRARIADYCRQSKDRIFADITTQP